GVLSSTSKGDGGFFAGGTRCGDYRKASGQSFFLLSRGRRRVCGGSCSDAVLLVLPCIRSHLPVLLRDASKTWSAECERLRGPGGPRGPNVTGEGPRLPCVPGAASSHGRRPPPPP